MRKSKEPAGLVHAALYIRVSGEEQKIKGLSLEAQQERLEAYAKERGWVIAGVYIDAAKTARKNMHKRAEFQRMMEAVKRDEVDVLLFCRLGRWFWSVSDYYKVMEILDAHNCNWVTSDEEYNTSTANGRLYINVKLSIAQNEADIDGERIEVVFDSKIAHGTVVSGNCPFGYQVSREKRLEINQEQADIVQDAFSHYESTVSQRGTIKYIREKYGVNWCDATFRRMLHEKLYTGVYDRGGRVNDNFCPPIITTEQFEHVQELTKRNFDHLAEELERCRLDWEVKAAKKKKRALSGTDKAAIKHKLKKSQPCGLTSGTWPPLKRGSLSFYSATRFLLFDILFLSILLP